MQAIKEPKCEYQSDFHKGKVEWHHLISFDGMCGVNLCEAHHSIIQGRKKVYNEETKPLSEQRNEIMELVYAAVRAACHNISEIDKN